MSLKMTVNMQEWKGDYWRPRNDSNFPIISLRYAMCFIIFIAHIYGLNIKFLLEWLESLCSVNSCRIGLPLIYLTSVNKFSQHQRNQIESSSLEGCFSPWNTQCTKRKCRGTPSTMWQKFKNNPYNTYIQIVLSSFPNGKGNQSISIEGH